MTALLKAVPLWVWCALVYGAATVGLVLWLVFRLQAAGLDLANERAAHSEDNRRIAQAAATESARVATETERRINDQQGRLNEANQKLDAAAASLAAAGDSQRRMRDTIAALNTARRGQASADPAAASPGAAKGSADMVPAELYFWADSRANELAAAFGDAHTRGQLCERDYDALTQPTPSR